MVSLSIIFLGGNLIRGTSFNTEKLVVLSSLILGILGYAGLILLLFGLYKKKQNRKLALLASGIIGFIIFFYNLTPQNSFIDWFQKTNKMKSLIGLSPIITSLIFILLILVDIGKKRLLTPK